MISRLPGVRRKALASVLALAAACPPVLAAAQDYGQYQGGQYNQSQSNQGQYDQGQYDQGQYDRGQYDQGQYNQGQYDQGRYGQPPGGPAPPPGQYAPPPPGAEASGSVYDDRAQRYDRDYADNYSRWAARYCVDRRTNAVAGAAIGGILGAVIGSGLAGRGSHGAGAFAGGAVGAVAGAAIGGNSGQGPTCPPGYVVEPGAPPLATPYAPAAIYGPAWYNPWIRNGGVWVYRPYRYWYWNHRPYWRPGWRGGDWRYHYRHW